MTIDPTAARGPVHLRADEHHLVDRRSSASSLVREPIGPRAPIGGFGPLTLVQDRVLPAGAVADAQQGTARRVYYVVSGSLTVQEDSDGVAATLHEGDIGILAAPAASAGTAWRERNDGDRDARTLVLEYPSEEASPAAAVEVVRHEGMPRVAPGGAFETTLALDRGDARLGGAVYELAGTRLDVGSTLPIELDEGESALVWCLDGRIQVDVDGAAPVTGVGVDDLVSVAAVPARRQLRVASQAPSHVLHAVIGATARTRTT